MPLRIVKRAGRQTLYVRGTVRGESIFESTGTDRPDLAEAYRVKREGEIWERSIFGARAVVTFATAVESYLRAAPRKRNTAAAVGRLLTLFGPRRLDVIHQTALDEAYEKLLPATAKPATRLRQVLTPLRAVLEHAARRDWCERPAFEVPKQPRSRIAFLLPDQATALVQAAAPHLRPLLVFLIATGARMSEALELDWADVDLDGARVTFTRTKQGRAHYVDLVPTARAALAALPHRQGRVFRPVRPRRKGRAETGQQWRVGEAWRSTDRNGGGQIKTAWAGAWRRAGLPGTWHEWTSAKGTREKRFQPSLRPHDLRHTAASWHYAVHTDLLRLQAAFGWANVNQAQVYAHLLPEASRGRGGDVARPGAGDDGTEGKRMSDDVADELAAVDRQAGDACAREAHLR